MTELLFLILLIPLAYVIWQMTLHCAPGAIQAHEARKSAERAMRMAKRELEERTRALD